MSATTLTLYNYWRSSASYRVRIALGVKQLAYHYVAVNILSDEQHATDYVSRNSMAQVPTLEIAEPGTEPLRLAQSLPIIEYLDDRWPEIRLLPADPIARAHARALAEIVNAGIQPLQNLSTTNAVKALGGDVTAWVRPFIERGLIAYAAAVAETAGRFSVGDAPSIADCCLVPQLYSARRFGASLAGLDRLLAIEAACEALPGFAAAHPDRQPDAKL
jgi:maleylpyruvate isomerase